MLDTVYVQNQPQGTRSPNAQVASPTQKIGTADDANLLVSNSYARRTVITIYSHKMLLFYYKKYGCYKL